MDNVQYNNLLGALLIASVLSAAIVITAITLLCKIHNRLKEIKAISLVAAGIKGNLAYGYSKVLTSS